MMSELCANSTRVRIAALVLLLAWGLALASPVALHAGNKKKNATTTEKPAEQKPQQDLSKLVWPSPPEIPRIRYTSYFAGMQFEKEDATTRRKSPSKPGWTVSPAPSRRTKRSPPRTSPSRLLGPYGMAVDSKGRLYVADQKVGAIFIFNTETKETEMIRNGFEAHFGLINGVAVDDDDRVFVSDGKLGKVLVFNAKHQVRGPDQRPGRPGRTGDRQGKPVALCGRYPAGPGAGVRRRHSEAHSQDRHGRQEAYPDRPWRICFAHRRRRG